ncbi:MAG: type IV toxin-antitoxin system AbiEi family antitoxin domain-containing protein [Coprobacillaceae bacterium]
MKYSQQIEKIIKDNNGVVTNEIFDNNKIPRIYLSRMVKNNSLTRVARGVYTTKDGIFDDYFFFQKQFSKAIFSFQSALYFHQLTDRVPFQKEVTLYKGYNPHSIPSNVKLHFVKREIYELGITCLETQFGNRIKVYDKEKTICDLIKNRSLMDVEIFKKAITLYFENKDKNLLKLYQYARIMKIEDKVNDIVEVVYG